MADINKIKEKLNDIKYIDTVLSEEKIDIRTISLTVDGVPESYSRERKGRGEHFYNPKSGKMTKIRKALLKKLESPEYNWLRELLSDSNANYSVELSMKYYLPIPKSTSIKNSIKMIYGNIKPAIRPDLDNYDKFILDTLHDVFYNDDKVVTRIEGEKIYSLDPRTDITAYIYIRK